MLQTGLHADSINLRCIHVSNSPTESCEPSRRCNPHAAASTVLRDSIVSDKARLGTAVSVKGDDDLGSGDSTGEELADAPSGLQHDGQDIMGSSCLFCSAQHQQQVVVYSHRKTAQHETDQHTTVNGALGIAWCTLEMTLVRRIDAWQMDALLTSLGLDPALGDKYGAAWFRC